MISWNAMICNLAERHECFGGKSYLHLQGFLRQLNSSKTLVLMYQLHGIILHHLLHLTYKICMPCSDTRFKIFKNL
jgi:hypothetical protein